jgi:hypothetical protein
MSQPLVLIPAYSHIDWRLSEVLKRSGLPCLLVHGCSDLVKARSRLLTDALRVDTHRFLFVDADMVPTPAQLDELATSSHVTSTSALTGCYLTQPDFIAAIAEDNQPIELEAEVRLIRGVAAGMGFAAVSRETVERIASKLPMVRDANGDRWHPFFLPFLVKHERSEELGGDEYYPEDYSFWWRVRALGEAQLWIDTHMVVGHVRQMILGR